jgi:hypothetical protein
MNKPYPSDAELAEHNRYINELSETKQYRKLAESFFEFSHKWSFPDDPVISQLYNGAKLLTGGAGEAKEAIARSVDQLAADYEFRDQVDGKDFPGQSAIVANALFDFITKREEQYPGIMANAVKFVRENIEFNKERFKNNPKQF